MKMAFTVFYLNILFWLRQYEAGGFFNPIKLFYCRKVYACRE